MKRKLLLASLLGVFLFGGMGFSASQSGGKVSGNQTVENQAEPRWGGPPWGGVWRYCRWVNPESPSCREFMKAHRENWQRMRELRAKIREEMREYCQKNHRDRFCQHMGPQGPCPGCDWHRAN